jgi:5-methyltetrahydropteroyltriglutamate--homocysteine methyltransferase
VRIPSPTLLHLGAAKFLKISKEAYPDGDEFGSSFFTDLAACYRKELKALYDAGCRYVQLDETSLALLCDPKIEKIIQERGYEYEELLQQYVELINESVDTPERKDMTISMRSCRGN